MAVSDQSGLQVQWNTFKVHCPSDEDDTQALATGIFDPSKMLAYKRGDCILLPDGTWTTLQGFYHSAYGKTSSNWKWKICATDGATSRKIAHIFDSVNKHPHRERCTCQLCKAWKQAKQSKRSKKSDSTPEPPAKKQKIEDKAVTKLEELITRIGKKLDSGNEEVPQSATQRLSDLKKDLTMLKDELLKITQDEILVIGFHGPCGVGKSSLLNALLKQSRLLPVKSHDIGTATPIQIHSSDEAVLYKATVDFITEEDWKKELECLCATELDVAESRDMTEEEIAARRIAFAKVKAVYGSKIDLERESYTSDDLLKLKNEVTKKLGDTNSEETGNLEITAEDGAKLRERVGPYITTKPSANSDGTAGYEYWPIVKAVTITIPTTEVLPLQVVLVDLPGNSDSNLARRAATEKFVMDCNRIWLVVDKNRCTTEKSFLELVGSEQHRQLKLDGFGTKLVVICTKTDEGRNLEEDIDNFGMQEETRDKSVGDKKFLVATRRNKVIKSNVEKSCSSLLKGQTPSRVRGASASADSATTPEEDLPPEANVNVFAVSASEYSAITGLTILDPEVFRDEDQTEIPRLQDYLRAEYKEARDSALQRWTSFTKLVQVMPQQQGPKTKRQLRSVKAKCRELTTGMKKSAEDANKQFKSEALRCLKVLDVHLDKGVEAAKSKMDETINRLKKVKIQTLRATCLRDGEFPTAKRGTLKISFNSDLAEPIMKEVEKAWAKIFDTKATESSLYQAATHAAKQMESEFSKHLEQLEAVLEDERMDELGLELIKKRRQLELDDRKVRLTKMIAKKQKKAYRCLEPSVQTSLKPTYTEAAACKGGGALQKMHKQIETEVRKASRDSMFENAAEAVRSQMHELEDRLQKSVGEFGDSLCSLNVFQHLWQDDANAKLFKEACSQLKVEETLRSLPQSITETGS